MAIPKYLHIKNDLKQQIIRGDFENGDRFYTESELAKKYDVSSITAIRALKELVQEGFIVRYQGKGSFVSRARKGKLVEFSDIELFPINNDKVTVLSIQRGNDPEILQKLSLTSQGYYYEIRRIRETNNTPYIYHQSYIPEQYINSNYPDLAHYSSIYQRFKLDYNIHMSEEPFVETNEIVFPTPETIATLLEITPEVPTVRQVKTTRLSATGQTVEYVESYKKWDFYKIELTSRQN